MRNSRGFSLRGLLLYVKFTFPNIERWALNFSGRVLFDYLILTCFGTDDEKSTVVGRVI